MDELERRAAHDRVVAAEEQERTVRVAENHHREVMLELERRAVQRAADRAMDIEQIERIRNPVTPSATALEAHDKTVQEIASRADLQAAKKAEAELRQQAILRSLHATLMSELESEASRQRTVALEEVERARRIVENFHHDAMEELERLVAQKLADQAMDAEKSDRIDHPQHLCAAAATALAACGCEIVHKATLASVLKAEEEERTRRIAIDQVACSGPCLLDFLLFVPHLVSNPRTARCCDARAAIGGFPSAHDCAGGV
eukprot:m.229877 g.229877  ORF g.229877 m.229877 type:complete len:260 (+) comp54260_c0_seq1:289-1068(+)